MTLLIAVGLGGFFGAVGRHLLGESMVHLTGNAHLGTLAANLLGCLLIGVLMVLAENGRLAPHTHKAVITGLLGSLTTFSTFGHETFKLIERGRYLVAGGYVALSLIAGLALVLLGRWGIGLWLRR